MKSAERISESALKTRSLSLAAASPTYDRRLTRHNNVTSCSLVQQNLSPQTSLLVVMNDALFEIDRIIITINDIVVVC